MAFGTEASNFSAADPSGSPDGYVLDIRGGHVQPVSVAPDGTMGNSVSASVAISISGNGQTVAYVSYADNLVPDDRYNFEEAFVWRAH